MSYWREPLEVDGVLEGSWGSWAIEIKTGSLAAADLKGLSRFGRRYPRFRSLVLCDDEARPVVERAGLEAMAWGDFLLRGPPARARTPMTVVDDTGFAKKGHALGRPAG
ncbi:MAG: hypothetical protein IPG96_21500 [Proteobacteria bacterium]|nr:hypothetical protein [Pseudomonadota bacterium]